MPTKRVDLTQDTWTKVSSGPCRVSTSVKHKYLGFIASQTTPPVNAQFEPWQEYVAYTFSEGVYINPFKTGIEFVIVTEEV